MLRGKDCHGLLYPKLGYILHVLHGLLLHQSLLTLPQHVYILVEEKAKPCEAQKLWG